MSVCTCVFQNVSCWMLLYSVCLYECVSNCQLLNIAVQCQFVRVCFTVPVVKCCCTVSVCTSVFQNVSCWMLLLHCQFIRVSFTVPVVKYCCTVSVCTSAFHNTVVECCCTMSFCTCVFHNVSCCTYLLHCQLLHATVTVSLFEHSWNSVSIKHSYITVPCAFFNVTVMSCFKHTVTVYVCLLQCSCVRVPITVSVYVCLLQRLLKCQSITLPVYTHVHYSVKMCLLQC